MSPRRQLAILFLAIVAVIIPGSASASITPAPETRIGDFELREPVLVGAITSRRFDIHRAIALCDLDLASQHPLRWKGMWRYSLGADIELYDARARLWSPALGTFLSIDEFAFHDRKGTLWSWPNQNPIRYADPSGHCGAVCVALGIVAVGVAYGYIFASDDAATQRAAHPEAANSPATQVALSLGVLAPISAVGQLGAAGRAASLAPAASLANNAQSCSASGRQAVQNFGGAGQQIGVIRLGQAGPQVALEARGPLGVTHQQLAEKAFGSSEGALGFTVIGDKIAVTASSTNAMPTMADLPGIADAMRAAGYQVENVLVQIGSGYVKLVP